MNSALIITMSLSIASTNPSLVDTVSGVDFYPLSPEIPSEGTLEMNEKECKKECLNEGKCVVDNHGSAMCSCSVRFFGEYCEYEGEPCGSSSCHHSSTCIELSLNEGSFIEHMCDCTDAYTEDTYYAGEFCQYASTQFCSESDNLNARQFCTNGGKCPKESHLPCICPEGFSGPRCAFQIGVDGKDYSQCDLPCQNGGTCQKGKNIVEQNEFVETIVDADLYNLISQSPDLISVEHCVCPEDYFGMNCEYQIEQCSSGEHLCFHGSTCVSDGDNFSCDCFSSKKKTAGLFCEYVASDECEQWIDLKNGHRGFCTNGGQCKVDKLGSAICSCPSGYMGDHCEFRVDIHDDPFKFSYEVDQSRAGRLRLLGVMLVSFVIVLSLVIISKVFIFRQTVESTAKTMDGTSSLSHGNIQLDNNIIYIGENGENRDRQGISAVELL